MPPATLQSRPAVAEGRNFFYQGVLFSFFSTRIKLFIHNGRSSTAAVSINNKITTRGLNLVFGPAAAHFFDKSATFFGKSGTFGLFLAHGIIALFFYRSLAAENYFPPFLMAPCTFSLASFLTIIWFLGRLAFFR